MSAFGALNESPRIFFNIAGHDDTELRNFYASIFGWASDEVGQFSVDVVSPIAAAIRMDPTGNRMGLVEMDGDRPKIPRHWFRKEQKMRINYVILFVSDMERSVAFYRDVFDLPLRFQTSEWTEFDTDGATLALHGARGSGQTDASSNPTPPGQCRPGLQTAALDEFHARVVKGGVECVQAPKETFGVRIAQYLDPDGLIISVSEPNRAS